MTEESNTQNNRTGRFVRNVLVKGILLFLILNFALGLIPPGSKIGRISFYNWLFPGRVRLPFGEIPDKAYNLSLYDLDAMFASHEISKGEKPENEFRIILIGDSATWGTLLRPEETLSGLINQDQWETCDGKVVHAYNLAYPSMSLTKDLMILQKALTYEPDLIIWPVTLESFPNKVQIETPLVANNPARVKPLINEFNLGLDAQEDDFVIPSYLDLTLVGRRRAIFDAIQLQYYGVMWAATGIDQTYPTDYTPAQRDFAADDDQFKGWSPGALPLNQLSMDILSAGKSLAGDIPILVVNEPILISQGKNSDIRYNFFYPRWAYDQYRWALAERSVYAEWDYVDLYDAIPQQEFTNSAVHLSPEGSQMFYERLIPTLEEMTCQSW
jgi:hypothetical protein